MKNIRRLLFPLAALLLACCAGQAARQQALLPAIKSAWVSVREEAAREAAAQFHPTGGAAVDAADAALQSADPVALSGVNWPLIELLADGDVNRRIATGAISPGVGESLRERLAQFRLAVATYLGATR